jgi:serine protease AprX
MRVLNDVTGKGDEFSVMAALQFVRHLNAHRDYTAIHGVNLSLSIHHDVSNYACGRTPVCEECVRVVNSGTVVVAAAGNQGYMHYLTTGEGASQGYRSIEGYRSISLTDPGNAEEVITVGATHGYRPHSYGVSYFSSRGPTGDGRLKPDIVAPGEKITSVVPGTTARVKDGTSLAAPHVSGAAALLMARHKELIGSPQRIKQILCETATDLGRERYFQGHGMVDILRALQSV